MKNFTIRQYASSKRVRLWEVAQQLGYSDANFSRKMRKEFTEEEVTTIKAIIDKIAGGENDK